MHNLKLRAHRTLCVCEDLGTKKVKVHEKLLIILDKSMKNIFGENTVEAVYYHLREKHLLKLEDIPRKPQTFAKAIKEIFGEEGAKIIETLLVKDLRTEFKIKGQEKVGDLVKCMDELKTIYIEN